MNELVKQLAPFHSRWRREVLQFTACMLDEAVFEAFCEKMLQQDDGGSGSNCELVRAFLKERESAQVEQMLSDRLLEALSEARDTPAIALVEVVSSAATAAVLSV